MVDRTRVSCIKEGAQKLQGPIVYWMSRDQRVNDNWALLYAIERANEKNVPVHLVFSLSNSFLNAQPRHFQFLLNGLHLVQKACKDYGIAFNLLLGNPAETIPNFVAEIGRAHV